MNIKTKKLWLHQVLLIQLLVLYTGQLSETYHESKCKATKFMHKLD